ncbi:hypothetical protein L1987_87975 [Smallanthus sonchifolius]|nr:hypothetical protein L1987_87975 [Smallanthus sonchifolius]
MTYYLLVKIGQSNAVGYGSCFRAPWRSIRRQRCCERRVRVLRGRVEVYEGVGDMQLAPYRSICETWMVVGMRLNKWANWRTIEACFRLKSVAYGLTRENRLLRVLNSANSTSVETLAATIDGIVSLKRRIWVFTFSRIRPPCLSRNPRRQKTRNRCEHTVDEGDAGRTRGVGDEKPLKSYFLIMHIQVK